MLDKDRIAKNKSDVLNVKSDEELFTVSKENIKDLEDFVSQIDAFVSRQSDTLPSSQK